MNHAHPRRALTIIATAGLVLALSATLVACGSKAAQPETKPVGTTAKTSLQTATSALATSAPDAKLLVVQTAGTVTATGTPTWAFLFGSPKSDKTYVVYVDKGQVKGAQEYGAAELTEEQWSAVPGADAWTVDSDTAYEKAVAAAGLEGKSPMYGMGMVTYVPPSAKSTVKPLVWSVTFLPAQSGGATATVDVDAKTGEAKVVK